MKLSAHSLYSDCRERVSLGNSFHVLICGGLWVKQLFKVEYHANAKYENPLKISEKIVYVGQTLMYPIMKKNNGKKTLPC